MDPRLLRLYTQELAYLREMGAEFAAEFPKVAGRLGMETLEVADPYVERLLEGFAFLAARVQLKIEAEQPSLIAQLIESVYPNFLSPVPSMLIARFTSDPTHPNLSKGHVLPRGSALVSQAIRGQQTQCEFRTSHDVTLWPVVLEDVRYFEHAPDLPLQRLEQGSPVRSGLRLRLRLAGGLQWAQVPLDTLRLYISAPDDTAFRLHELMAARLAGTWVNAGPDAPLGAQRGHLGGPETLCPAGFAPSESLLPETRGTFSGYRLLQELAALPQRLLFFDLKALSQRLRDLKGAEAEVVVLFSIAQPSLEPLIDRNSLSLYCTPAINLFPKRLDRIPVDGGSWEYHAVPDRTRPLDFEVHSIQSVQGHGTGRFALQEFLPLYEGAVPGQAASSPAAHGHYAVRRTPRTMSTRQQVNGPRTAYLGDEVYLTIVDPRHRPYAEDLRQLSVQALVTNRDLPVLLPSQPSQRDGHGASPPALWRLDAPGPVERIDVLRGPTRPVSRQPEGDLGWRLVSHLSLNHLELLDQDPRANAAALRRMLGLYGNADDAAWQRMTEGVLLLEARTLVRRLPYRGPITFGSGVSFTLEVDESAFQGMSALLFGSALDVFLARHAAINSFSQLSLRSNRRGHLVQWPARLGQREVT